MEYLLSKPKFLPLDIADWPKSGAHELIERVIRTHIERDLGPVIYNVLGKRMTNLKSIRPFIFLNMLRNLDGVSSVLLLRLCIAIEIWHQATLIFDDVIDYSPYRHGFGTSLYRKFGNDVSSAGLADHIAASLMLLAERQMILTRNIEIIYEFNEMRAQMFRGQFADVFLDKKPKRKTYTEWLFNRAYLKTTAFMSFIFYIYGVLANKEPEKLQQLKLLGEHLGIVYQIADDLSDLDETNRFANASFTFQMAFLLDSDLITKEERLFLLGLVKNRNLDNKKFKQMQVIFNKYKQHIVSAAKRQATKYIEMLKGNPVLDASTKYALESVLNSLHNKGFWKHTVM